MTTGARTMGIERVKLDASALPSLVAMTPEPARGIVKALAEGRAPRAMLLAGEVDPSLLEEVLSDLALRGAIQGVWTNGGEEVLVKALDALLAPPEPTVRSAPPPSRPAPRSQRPPSSRPPPPKGRPSAGREADMTPSSLADAVMRELSDRAPELRSQSSNPPPIVEPSDLRPRSSKPPKTQAVERAPSLPPDAVVPELSEEEAAAADAGERHDATEIDAPVAPEKDEMSALQGLDALDALDGLDAFEPFEASAPGREDESPAIPVEIESAVSAPVGPKEAPLLTPHPAEPIRTPLSSVATKDPRAEERPAMKSRWPWVIAIALAGGGVLLGALAMKPAATNAAAASGDGAELVQSLPLTSGVPVRTESSGVSYDSLPESLSVLPGQGLLEVNVGASGPLKVDGVDRGSGPIARVPLTAGPHEVTVGSGERRSRSIEVRAGRTARVNLPVSP